jgi:hypothetical protein
MDQNNPFLQPALPSGKGEAAVSEAPRISQVDCCAIIKVLQPSAARQISLADRNEFIDAYKFALNHVGAGPRALQSDSPQTVFIDVETPQQTLAFCEAFLCQIGSQNKNGARHQFKRAMAAIGLRQRQPAGAAPDPLSDYSRAQRVNQGLRDLLISASAGQVWLADEVYQVLSPQQRAGFQQVQGCGLHRGYPVWMRQVDDHPALRPDGTFINVDMAHSTQALDSLGAQLNDPDEASQKLNEQINHIFEGGFALAAKSLTSQSLTYDACLEQIEGDGAVFRLPTAADAHVVAAGILQKAEELNVRARESKTPQALRCFRIGVSSFNMIDSGDVAQPNNESYVQAKRLQEWGPTGEIRITEETYKKLPRELQIAYGGVEEIPGKPGERRIAARRCAAAPRALWAETDKVTGQPFPAITANPDRPQVSVSAPNRLHCFVAIPLRDEQRVRDVYEQLIVPACQKAGYDAVRATDIAGRRNEAIPEHLQESPMVLAYLGTPAQGWNANVILEIGFRMATKRPLVILGDTREDGTIPDYQSTLPFQLVHHNIITAQPRPADSIDAVVNELRHNYSKRDPSEWDTPLPIIEIRFSTTEEVTVTDFNEAAAKLFGPGTFQIGGDMAALAAILQRRCEPRANEARRDEWDIILGQLNMWHRSRAGKYNRAVSQPRIPIVFKDAPPNPKTGKPDGYLPLVVRYSLDGVYIQARFLYIRVSASMTFDEALGCYVCDP